MDRQGQRREGTPIDYIQLYSSHLLSKYSSSYLYLNISIRDAKSEGRLFLMLFY